MLVRLSIRDIVIIDRLDLSFGRGLSALTGETGAGKSILLDSLGLALGARADAGLVRRGAAQGVVVASFDLDPAHPVFDRLTEDGLSGEDGELVLRRVLGSDGRSKAFVNDQPVSAATLRTLGDMLIEVHGQFDDRGLLDPAGHRTLLDAFAGHDGLVADVRASYEDWTSAREALNAAVSRLEAARKEEEFLRHAAAEIAALDPQGDEEEALADRRALLQAGVRAAADIAAIEDQLDGEGTSLDAGLHAALRRLDRMAEPLRSLAGPAIEAFDRAAIAFDEGRQLLAAISRDLGADPHELERIEERLFALRGLARKHGVPVEALGDLGQQFADNLAAIDKGDAEIARLKTEEKDARAAFEGAVAALSASRNRAAGELDAAIAIELPPLKLGAAQLKATTQLLDPADWGREGGERVAFEVSTNPGAPLGPLKKIASGGELARFMLALKVALAARGSAPTLVFDEVDQGIGGATADAVGERLSRLAAGVQVLVVTHSPQVASRADGHYHIAKAQEAASVVTRVKALTAESRTEEIARMLSGSEITSEARAQAARLLGQLL